MVIVDTSVAYKWTDKNEEFREKALNILQAHIDKKNQIIVPDLIFYELANAWATKTKLSFSVIKNNLEDLEDSNLIIEPVNFVLLKKAILFSKNHKVSVYDAIYAILAKEKNCELITADDKFVGQVRIPFVKSLKDYSRVKL